MRAVRHHDLAAFRARVTPLLIAREAENNLPLGLLAVEHAAAPVLVEVIGDEGRPAAIALQTPPFNLIVTDMTAPMVDCVVELFAVEGLAVPGVNGPTVAARGFAEAWSRRHGARSFRHQALRIFQCTTLRAPSPPVDGGSARVATSADVPLILDWCRAFAADVGTTTPPRLADVERRVAGSEFMLWQTERSVAMAGVARRTPHGAAVAYVYTPPEVRQRGYASNVTAALTGRELAAGHGCFLYTDLANPKSNKIYQALGYVGVCDVEEWRFG